MDDVIRMINRAREAIFNLSLHDTGGIKRVATDKALSTLNVQLYTGASGEKCPITFEELEQQKTIVSILSCGHVFSAEAIYRWLSTEKSECPVCRLVIESREVSVTNQSQNIETIGILDAYNLTPIQNLLHEPDLISHDDTQALVNVICENDDVDDISWALCEFLTHYY